MPASVPILPFALAAFATGATLLQWQPVLPRAAAWAAGAIVAALVGAGLTVVVTRVHGCGTAREGTIACVARPAHLGRNTQVWDATVSKHGDGKPIALFRCTQMVLWPKAR